MKTEVRDVVLTDIVVEERFRTDLGDLTELIESIKFKGVIQPITVSTKMRLLAGGRRYEACRRIPLATIPCVVRETTGELDEREIELIENIHRKDMNWQERCMLEARIHALKSLSPGWGQRATADLMGEAVGGLNKNLQLAQALEKIPELGKLKTREEAWKLLKGVEEKIVLAELQKRVNETSSMPNGATPGSRRAIEHHAWQYANENYIVGDFLTAAPMMSQCIFDFAEVDPPYGIDLLNVKRRDDSIKPGDSEYHEVDRDDYPEFLARAAEETYRVLKPNSFCVWWFGPTHWGLHKTALVEAGFYVSEVPAIWYKIDSPGQTNQPDINLANVYEPFFVARKGRPVMAHPGRSNVLCFKPVSSQQKIHPTERPLALMNEILDTFTVPGMSVVVPFLGSGVTLRAAYLRNMAGVGWDLSDVHKSKFLLRVQEDTQDLPIRTEPDDSEEDLDLASQYDEVK